MSVHVSFLLGTIFEKIADLVISGWGVFAWTKLRWVDPVYQLLSHFPESGLKVSSGFPPSAAPSQHPGVPFAGCWRFLLEKSGYAPRRGGAGVSERLLRVPVGLVVVVGDIEVPWSCWLIRLAVNGEIGFFVTGSVNARGHRGHRQTGLPVRTVR